ncbi:uncharacterized protein MONOS_8236 [Monocercomonoides exilis]|uniref:uncharacterized protein n=1 Tax=Monocercomonoides exilis TaxID=2049356 RepID=UPI003559E356|nr:hypothetical protein MONOS_8236 [Monocercomonoides exilis]|eukprot:MONOS_8236.1-p1 / transcript=MONOS_8236.1 / gene=MONOS_8236 / organism=Monocercomonoides_exilis_PA203 / gene_product=unspecified product / transcript_product=unspecified product / location=Mono_scaffold00305:41168-47262(+) / protein_length=2013 / sequence_SO=supercontig / SO=protein_coding / is_pseudo=false
MPVSHFPMLLTSLISVNLLSCSSKEIDNFKKNISYDDFKKDEGVIYQLIPLTGIVGSDNISAPSCVSQLLDFSVIPSSILQSTPFTPLSNSCKTNERSPSKSFLKQSQDPSSTPFSAESIGIHDFLGANETQTSLQATNNTFFEPSISFSSPEHANNPTTEQQMANKAAQLSDQCIPFRNSETITTSQHSNKKDTIPSNTQASSKYVAIQQLIPVMNNSEYKLSASIECTSSVTAITPISSSLIPDDRTDKNDEDPNSRLMSQGSNNLFNETIDKGTSQKENCISEYCQTIPLFNHESEIQIIPSYIQQIFYPSLFKQHFKSSTLSRLSSSFGSSTNFSSISTSFSTTSQPTPFHRELGASNTSFRQMSPFHRNNTFQTSLSTVVPSSLSLEPADSASITMTLSSPSSSLFLSALHSHMCITTAMRAIFPELPLEIIPLNLSECSAVCHVEGHININAVNTAKVASPIMDSDGANQQTDKQKNNERREQHKDNFNERIICKFRFSAAFDPSQLADVEQQEDLSIQIEGEEPNLLENTTNEAGTEISSSKGSHDNEDILPFEQHFGKEGSEKRRKDKTFVSPDAENFQIKQKQVDEKEYDTSHSLDTPIHQHFESDEKIHNHLAQTEKENYSKDDSPQKELLSEFDDVKEESESHESKNENSSEEEKQEEKDYIDSEQDHSKKNKKTNRETPTLSDLHSMLTDLLRLTLSKPDRKIEAKCETDDLDEKEKGKSNEKREKSVTDHVAGKQNEKDSKQIEEDDNELLLHQHTASSSRASASSPLPSIVPPSSLPSFHLQTPFISNTISVSSSKNSENSYKFPRTVSPSQNGGISTEMSFPVNEFPSMFSVNPHLDAGKVSDSEPLFHIPSPSPPISCNFSNSLPPPPPPPHKLITVGSSQSLHSTSTAFAATLPTSFETYPSDATSSTVPALHQYSLHHNPSTGQSILPLPRHSQSPPRHQPSTTIFQTPSFISSNSETKTNTFTSTMPSLPSISLPPSPTQSFITSGVSFPFLPSSSSTLSSSSPSSAMRMPSYSNNLSTSGKSRNPLSPARQPPVARSSLASARNKLFSNQKERDYQNKSKKSEMISTTIPIEDANEDHKGTSIEFGKPERKDKISRTDAEGSDCGRNNVTFSVSSQTSPIRDSERLTNPKIHMDSYHQDAFARENQNEEIGKHLQSGSSSCSPNTVSFMKKCDSNLPKPNSSSDKDNTRQDFVEEKILKEVMKMKKALDAIEKRSKNKKTERHDSFASERKISPDRKYEKKEMERMRDKLIKLIEEFKRSTDSFAETQRNKSTSFSPPPRSTVLEYDSPSSYRQSSFHSNSEARTKDNRRRVFSDSAKRKFAHKKHESAPHQMESYIDQIFSTKDFERKHLKHKELPRHRSHHSHRNHQHLSKSIAKTSSASSIEPKVTVQKSHIQTQTDDLSPQNYRPISQSISLPQNSLLQMSGTVNQNATPTSTNSQIFPNATVSIATTPLVPTTTPTQITTNPITPQDIPPIVITLPRSHSHRHYHHHRHHRRHSPSSISSINKTRSRSQRRGTSTKQLDSKSKSPSIESKRMESFNKGQGMLDEHSNISKTSHSSLSHSKRSSCNPHIHHSPGKQSVKVVLDPEKIHSLANQTAFLKSSSSSLPHSNTAKPHGKIADSSNDMHQTSHSHSHSQVHSNTQPESNSPRSILGRLLNTHSKKKNTSSCESFTPSYAKNESVSFRSSPLLNRSSSPVLLHSIRSPSAGSSPTSSKGQRSELLYSPPRQQPMPIASHPATDSQFSSPISDGKTEPDAVAREATEKTRRSSHSPSSSRPSSSFSDPARNKQMDSPSSPHQSSKSHKSHKLPRTVIPSRRPTSASSFSFSLCSPLSSSTFTQTCEEPSLQFSSTPLKDNYLGTSKKQQLLNLSKKHIIFEVTPAKSTLEKSLWFENQTKEPLFWRITANGDAVSINEGEKAQQRNDEVAQSSSLYSNETSKVNIQKVCDEQPRQTEIKPVFDIKTAESGWIAPELEAEFHHECFQKRNETNTTA